MLGCSTGEEAYSVAMAFAEFCADAGREIPLQVFATDLNAAGIEKARAGIYSKNIAQDVSPERLRRFFSEVDGSYRVRKSIRDSCVFARHNVLAEPPFSRMDLISCRNLLIYLDSEVQQRVVPILHYALQPSGYLWLGSVGDDRIVPRSVRARRCEVQDLCQKAGRLTRGVELVRRQARARRCRGEVGAAARAVAARRRRSKEAERLLLARYAPPSVLINGDLEILQFRGDTGLYLSPAPGRPASTCSRCCAKA